jgi:hypothetical protein
LYQESAALDDKKPPARQVTLSSASQSDCEEEEEPKNNEPDNEVAPQSVARKGGNSNGALDDKKLPARRVTLSPIFKSESGEEEESENEEMASRQSVARKRHFPSDSEEGSDDATTPSPRISKIKSQKARKKYARLEQQAWLGGGDEEFSADDDSNDEDSDLEAEEGFHRYELEPTPSRRQSTLDFWHSSSNTCGLDARAAM